MDGYRQDVKDTRISTSQHKKKQEQRTTTEPGGQSRPKGNIMKKTLKERRIEAHLKQRELAEAAQVSLFTYQRFESGELELNKAAAIIVKRLADAFGCQMEDLITEKKWYVVTIYKGYADENSEAFTNLEKAKQKARDEAYCIRRDKRKGDMVELRDYAEDIEDEDCNCFDYDTVPFEERETVDYRLTAVKAIAKSAGDPDSEIQDAILIHTLKDPFKDSDCILFGYDIWEFDTDEEITDALQANTPSTAFTIREDGTYIA